MDRDIKTLRETGLEEDHDVWFWTCIGFLYSQPFGSKVQIPKEIILFLPLRSCRWYPWIKCSVVSFCLGAHLPPQPSPVPYFYNLVNHFILEKSLPSSGSLLILAHQPEMPFLTTSLFLKIFPFKTHFIFFQEVSSVPFPYFWISGSFLRSGSTLPSYLLYHLLNWARIAVDHSHVSPTRSCVPEEQGFHLYSVFYIRKTKDNCKVN